MKFYRLHIASNYAKKYAAPVISAALLFAGISKFIEVLQFVIANGLISSINFIIRNGFRDQMTLHNLGWLPWQFHIFTVAVGTMLVVLGIFVGLWVNSRKPGSTLFS